LPSALTLSAPAFVPDAHTFCSILRVSTKAAIGDLKEVSDLLEAQTDRW